MNCPRCKSPIPPISDPDAVVTCPGCGSRLMTRSAALRSQGANAAAAPPARHSALRAKHAAIDPAELPPSATMPPTPARLLGFTKPREAPAGGEPQAPVSSRAHATAADPDATGRHEPAAGSPETGALQRMLEELTEEMRAVRATQERILALLAQGAASPADGEDDDDERPAAQPIRARRRKSVVLIDDDESARQAAVAELQQAEVPVRAFADGNAALSGIAEEKPDVIVLDLGLRGDMAGKDVINMIKATMEWVDIPIVLWTAQATNQKEARQIHGADEVVAKSAGAGALVSRVIALFRRG